MSLWNIRGVEDKKEMEEKEEKDKKSTCIPMVPSPGTVSKNMIELKE